MNQNLFINRRLKLMKQIEDVSLVVLFSLEAPHKTADQFYPYEINRNFYYLTGLKRSNFTLVLQKDGTRFLEYLFIEEPSDYATKWLGRRMTKEEASDISGIAIQSIYYLDQFESLMHQQILSGQRKALVKAPKTLFIDLLRPRPFDIPAALQKITKIRESYPELAIKNVNELIDSMRMIKDEDEIEEIKNAVAYSKVAIEAILSTATPGINERALVAIYEYALKSHGSEGNSFNPICAAGARATTLHYEENDQVAEDGDLVLIDMGALSGPYASDISRTFPVNGKFNDRQRQLYDCVLSVNKACIEFVKPGILMSELNAYARNLLAEKAVALGLIKSPEEIGSYYYHNVSHYLGLDVHDVGNYLTPLKPGIVLTIEPGIYVEEEKIGIRIEDNVLVTESGSINLSSSIIKEIEDIEAFMAKQAI